MVKALIFTDEQEIVSGVQEFLPNVPNIIAMVVSCTKMNIEIYFLKTV
jgi:hypothetical protein